MLNARRMTIRGATRTFNSTEEKMMTLKHLRKSVDLAERLAKSEQRLKSLRRLGISARVIKPVIEEERKTLGHYRSEVAKDGIAAAFLPQARAAVRMREAREQAIKKTVFGRLSEVVEHLSYGVEGLQKSKLSSPADKNDNVVWKAFCGGLKKRGMKDAFVALHFLLNSAEIDLMYTELPPLPPPYRFGRKAPCRRK